MRLSRMAVYVLCLLVGLTACTSGDSQQHLRSAAAHLLAGAPDAALKDLQGARRRGASWTQAGPLYLSALLAEGRPGDVLKEIQTAQVGRTPETFEVIAQAKALVLLGRFSEAEAKYRSSLAANAASPEAALGLADLLVQSNRFEATRALLVPLESPLGKFAAYWRLRGSVAEHQGDVREAVFDLEQVWKHAGGQTTPAQTVDSLEHLGALRIAIGDREGADATQRDLAAIAPDSAVASLLAARVSLANGDLGRAEESLQHALTQTPSGTSSRNTEARVLLAMVNLRRGVPEKAVAVLQPISLSKHDAPSVQATVLELLSTAQRRANRRQDGIATLRDLVRTFPGNLQGHRALLSALYGNDQRAEALRHIDELESANSLAPDAMAQLSLFLLQHSELQRARDLLDRAVAALPQDPRIRMTQADFAARTGDTTGAERLLRDLIRSVPEEVAPRLALAKISLRQQHAQEAADLTQAAMQVSAHRAGTEHAVGLLYLQNGRPQLALPGLRAAVAAEPGSLSGWCDLSAAALATGELNEAILAAMHAIDLNPDAPLAIATLARVELKRGRSAAALARILAAESNHADDPAIWMAESEIRTALRQDAQARAAWQRAALLGS